MKIGKRLITVDEFITIVHSHFPGVSHRDINISLSCYDNSCGCGCGVGAPHADLIIEKGATKKSENDINLNEFLQQIKHKCTNLSSSDIFIKVQAFDNKDYQAFAHNLQPDFSGHDNGVYWQILIKSREDIEKKEKEDRKYLLDRRGIELELEKTPKLFRENSLNLLPIDCMPKKIFSGRAGEYPNQVTYKLTNEIKSKMWSAVAFLGVAFIFPFGTALSIILFPQGQDGGAASIIGGITGVLIGAIGYIKSNSC